MQKGLRSNIGRAALDVFRVAAHIPYRTPERSNHFARFVEGKARRARMELRRVAVAKIAEEIGFNRRAGEERGVDLRIVEAGHWAAIETQRPRRQHQVRALQR